MNPLIVTEYEMGYATAFATAFNLTAPKLESVNGGNDCISFTDLTITKVVGSKKTISGNVPAVAYLVEEAVQTYSYHSGYDVDVNEVGEFDTLTKALQECARRALEWAMYGYEYVPENPEQDGLPY